MAPGRILRIGCTWGVAYGLLNFLSNIILLPSAPFISLRPQVALPMVVGIAIHPLAGFLSGFSGNVLGDALSGYGVCTFWNWHTANGLMGLLPGLILSGGSDRIATVRAFGILEAAVVATSAVAVGAATLLDVLFLKKMTFPSSLHAWILPAFLTDVVNGFILVPALLLLLGRIALTLETRTILLVTALLVAAILATASAIVASVWDDLVSPEAIVENFYIAGIVSVGLLILGFTASLGFVRRITDPLYRLTRAGGEVEQGRYDLDDLDGVSARPDELGRLSRAFQAMAGKVREREERLQRQVAELQITIDRTRKDQDVSEIVGTEYFQRLKEKAQQFRKT